MAIAPKVLQDKLVKECKEIESIIDSTLKNSNPETDGSYIIERPEQLLDAHWVILSEKYTTAGWHSAKLTGNAKLTGSTIKFTVPAEAAKDEEPAG